MCKGDGGQHASCCGSNTFTIASGDNSVLIDGKPAARKGDKTRHCGGIIKGNLTLSFTLGKRLTLVVKPFKMKLLE